MHKTLLVLSLAAWSLPGQAPEKPASALEFSVKNIDATANPCVNFYQYACGSWMKNNPIPADQARWGRFGQLEEHNRDVLREILEAASKPDAPPVAALHLGRYGRPRVPKPKQPIISRGESACKVADEEPPVGSRPTPLDDGCVPELTLKDWKELGNTLLCAIKHNRRRNGAAVPPAEFLPGKMVTESEVFAVLGQAHRVRRRGRQHHRGQEAVPCRRAAPFRVHVPFRHQGRDSP